MAMDAPVPIVFDVKPGPGKKSLVILLFTAAVMVGMTWALFGLFNVTFAVGIQLFAVAMLTGLIVPPLFAYFSISKYAWAQALVQAGVILVGTAALLVAQGIWITGSGRFELSVLVTTAALLIGFAAFVVAYLSIKFKIEI